MTEPMVSVIITAYNEQNYIGKTIESLLNSTYTNKEIIVVDDGSTDDTLSGIKKFAEKYSEIIIIKNSRNLGITASVTKAVAAAHGELIARVDAGDCFIPEKIEIQVKYMLCHPECSLVGSSALLIDERGEQTGVWSVPSRVDALSIYHAGAIIQPTVMIRVDALTLAGGYRWTAPAEDMELWLRFLAKGYQVHNITQPLLMCSDRKCGVSNKEQWKLQKNIFIVKFLYLRYFFSIPNVLSTLRSLCGMLLPTPVLRIILRMFSPQLSRKVRV